ncbi:unnamed protein product [Heligmosomoides polygyrus]|uniref:Endo/exonuclease/phosphatase domain-containing protein n=1 Tax=Heligmosomoides polygyrus TaxID=6339 RepID=A0A183F4U1_HELPZ|nr:unnamed protein product [Heligmosomoides polygyrus]
MPSFILYFIIPQNPISTRGVIQPKPAALKKYLTSQIGRLPLKRFGFDCVLCECFNIRMRLRRGRGLFVELKKFFKEDHTVYRVIVGDFNAKIGHLQNFYIVTPVSQSNEQGERLSSSSCRPRPCMETHSSAMRLTS